MNLLSVEMDLKSLLRYRDSNVVSNFLNFRVSSQSLTASLIWEGSLRARFFG